MKYATKWTLCFLLGLFIMGAMSLESYASTTLTKGTTALTGGSYILKSDVTNDTTITITGDVTIDLNGYTLTGPYTASVITVSSGTLTLKDSGGTGILTSATNNNSDAVSSGGGVVVSNNGTFILQSGTISGNQAKFSGGGVVVSKNGTFTMNSGRISNNSSPEGGGVLVEFGGTFTMNGGSISNNSATKGGGVLITGTFTMNGGSISGNDAAECGGGVMFWKGTFTMKGGSITGNTAAVGGGVFIEGEHVSDANISTNRVLTLANAVRILDNQDYQGFASNVYLETTTDVVMNKPNFPEITTRAVLDISGISNTARVGLSFGPLYENATFTTTDTPISTNVFILDSPYYAFRTSGSDTLPQITFGYRFSGQGTEASPYRISSLSDLQALGAAVNFSAYNSSSVYYEQGASISISGGYHPIGGAAHYSDFTSGLYMHFYANYNGQGYTIYGRVIGELPGCYGIFKFNAGVITNLHSAVEFVVTTDSYSTVYIGSIAAAGTGTIRNCYATGKITLDTGTEHELSTLVLYVGERRVGGIIGSLEGIVEACYSTVEITVSGDITPSDTRYFLGAIFGDTNQWHPDSDNSGYPQIIDCYYLVGSVNGASIVGEEMEYGIEYGPLADGEYTQINNSTTDGVGRLLVRNGDNPLTLEQMSDTKALDYMRALDFETPVWYVNLYGTPALREVPWKPTEDDDIYRHSLCWGRAPEYQELTGNYGIRIDNSVQGPLCFAEFHRVREDYILAATYNIYVDNELCYETENIVQIELTVPEELQQEGRSYRMICVSEGGSAYVLEDLDENSNTITFETNRFYAYALCYLD